jgi:hypothetical protein
VHLDLVDRGHHRAADGLADFAFVAVRGGGVDEPVAGRERRAHGLRGAIARALLLDDAERAHLFDLVRAANATAAAQATRRPARQPVRPELRNMLEAISGVPAYIRNGRLDILTGNAETALKQT